MSCDKANNCKKYKMNIGNPNDWENHCNRCNYNISDYDIGYNKAIDDFAGKIKSNDILGYVGCLDKIVDEIAEQLKVGGENDKRRKRNHI